MGQETLFLKLDLLFPDGCSCPQCGSRHFHPTATVLVGLYAFVDGKNHWIARSECLGERCKGYIDWSFDPDRSPLDGQDTRRLVSHKKNPLALIAYQGFPRSRTKR